MNSLSKPRFRGCITVGASVCAMLTSTSVFAQVAMADKLGSSTGASAAVSTDTAAPGAAAIDATSGLADIVVTATKRDTNLQNTPIAIAVMNAKDLEDRHVLSLADLGDGAIPSLHIVPLFARNSALTMDIRGIGSQSDANQPARDQGVGVYIDGIYLGRAQGLGAALFDVQQIEVDKGPQGTLFGRNTEGGAISIVTKKPSGKFDMNTTLGASNYGGYEASTHIDLPTYHNFSVKLDGLVQYRNGTVRNPDASQLNFNAYDRRGVAARVLWQPSSNFSADYGFDISYDATTPSYVQLLAPSGLPGLYSNSSPLLAVQSNRATVDDFGVPLQWSVTKTNGHRLTLDWKAGSNLEVKSLSSYRELYQSQYDDAEVSLATYTGPNTLFGRYSLAHQWQKQFSQELQIIGSTNSIKYVGGAFFYEEKVNDNAQTPDSLEWGANNASYTELEPPVSIYSVPGQTFAPGTYPLDRASAVTSASVGVFGQGVWTPDFAGGIAHLTLGGRYTRDKKDGYLALVNGQLPSYINAAGQTITGILRLDKAWDHFDPLINLSLDVARDIHLYGKWSTGYKAGGANSRSLTYSAFNPESVSAFEVGAKTEFLDHHVRLNFDAFDETYKNPQIDWTVTALVGNRGTTETTNGQGNGRSKGVEADLSINPLSGLTLTASYTYIDMHLPVAPNPFVTGSPLTVIYPTFTPPNAASGAIDYVIPLRGDMEWRGHLDANYSDGYKSTPNDPTLTDSSFIVNGRLSLANIGLGDSGARMTLSVWARNLLNEANTTYKTVSPPVLTYGIFNQPRTFGGDINIKF